MKPANALGLALCALCSLAACSSGEEAIVGHTDGEMKRKGLGSPIPMSAEERHEAILEQREINKERDAERKEAENWDE